jgi:ATP-dependent Lhr-like helicase
MASDAPGQLHYHTLPPPAETALAALSEPVRAWFRHRFGEPTAAQCLAWPALAAGRDLLLCAPTGSGKTLAAFLPILDRLLAEPAGPGIRCLYVTPLKALGTDARRNLRLHLRGIRDFAPTAGGASRRVRVGLRTGDTTSRERHRFRRRPPDILLTTPESLAVLLCQPAAVSLFAGLHWVVVDEVHALAANKRGADLAVSLERLAALANDPPQRIGLSATCRPPAEAARFLTGWDTELGDARPCTIAEVADTAPLTLMVEPLEEAGGFLNRLVDRLGQELAAHRTTLIFVNVRSFAERLAWALRRQFPAWDESIAVHHSALAAARRRSVERRLKRGRLRAVVSSTSLELGIDIGSVDAVVLVHPPGNVVRLLQRVGRGGHGPGRPRRGLVLTAGAAELLEAAVTGARCAGQPPQPEPLYVPAWPLDVLCQQLLGMAAQRAWSADEAFDLVRGAYPYRDLPRSEFDACLHYLSGRHADGRAWLPARLAWEGDTFTIRDERTARLLQRNVGTILAEEPRVVLLAEAGSRTGVPEDSPPVWPVGQVDEAFADRLQPGDRFLLDGRCLEYRHTDGFALVVEEVIGRPVPPRWGGEGWPLSADLARRLFVLRTRAAEALREGSAALADLLRREYGLEGPAVARLVAYFQRQEAVSEVPDGRGCLVEVVVGDTATDYYVHTPLNRCGNDALARVLVWRLAREAGRSATSVVADLGFALLVPRPWQASSPAQADLTPDNFRRLLGLHAFADHLTEAVAASDLLRERFRRVAFTGLMLLRNPLGRRRRVGGAGWAERRLFDQVRAAEPDFVLLRQALREVREDCSDLPAARTFLEEIADRPVRFRHLPCASPFVESWTQLAAGPVESAETPDETLRRLHAVLTGQAEG